MIVILDFGSQYSELIARRIRECNVFSEVVAHTKTIDEIKEKYNPKGIILSGGPSSVFDPTSPTCDQNIFDSDIPVLGICYGMQYMAHSLGGEVKQGSKHEYGKSNFYIDNNFDLFEGLWLEMAIWMSHGDEVISLPHGFQRLGHTPNCNIAAFGDQKRKLYGVQFHPEVVHTPKGIELIKNFVHTICGCEKDWTADSFVETSIKQIRETVKDDKVLCALSGGVDSTVVSALLNKAVGKNLTCMFIDQGFMRKNEVNRIKEIFTDKFDINLIYVDAKERFYKKIDGIVDPEKKES